MYTVYFEERSITVSTSVKKQLSAICNIPGYNSKPEEIPYLFDKQQHISNIMVFSAEGEYAEDTFSRVFSRLIRVDAGGGLVTNKDGDYLLIFRNGKWDLPKGKQEEGEDISVTAVREVSEECGISEIEIEGHICDTYHTFHRDGKFCLKYTSWYKMIYQGDCSVIKPQTEEGIEKVLWTSEENLQNYLGNTYPSIKEVFENHRRERNRPSSQVINL